MLYNDYQCIEIFGTDRKLKQALKDKRIYKIEKGIYSYNEFEPDSTHLLTNTLQLPVCLMAN